MRYSGKQKTYIYIYIHMEYLHKHDNKKNIQAVLNWCGHFHPHQLKWSLFQSDHLENQKHQTGHP